MPQSAKERSHLFGIVQKRRHCHQSFEFEVREFTDLFTERQNFVRRNAGFRVFPAEIDFQKDRQPFAKYAVKQVSVQQIGGGEDGNGYMNAHRRIDRERNIKIVSGWLVRPHDKALNKTEIVQHWWNVDAAAKTYFDVSPGIGRDCEYVLDMDMAEYGITHFDDPAANAHTLTTSPWNIKVDGLVANPLVISNRRRSPPESA